MGKELRLPRGRGYASGAERNGFAQYAHTVPSIRIIIYAFLSLQTQR